MKKSVSVLLAFCLLLAIAVPLLVFTASADSVDEDWQYTVSNGEATIIQYTGNDTDVVIPSTLGGYPVTSIGDYAFQNCANLVSITIGNGVMSIGNGAFNHCLKLRRATIYGSPSISSSSFRNSSFSVHRDYMGYVHTTPTSERLNVTLQGFEGSNVQSFAVKESYNFQKIPKTNLILTLEGDADTVSVSSLAGSYNLTSSESIIVPSGKTVTMIISDEEEFLYCWQNAAGEIISSDPVLSFTATGFEMQFTAVSVALQCGDVDGNQEIDIGDITSLAKFVAGWNLDDTFRNRLADCDADGRVNIADITTLAKFVAGWKITLGPQE